MEQPFGLLAGKVLVRVTGLEKGSDRVVFSCDDCDEFSLSHDQDCCESVSIEDVAGDVDDLIGTPILMAEESTSSEHPDEVKALVEAKGADHYWESHTWTFYRLSTIKGSLVIRWLGESNGWYSESVSFCHVPA